MNSFEELSKKISQDIDSEEIRSRSRTEQEQIRFNYAVRHHQLGGWSFKSVGQGYGKGYDLFILSKWLLKI